MIAAACQDTCNTGGGDTPDAPQNAAQVYVALCALQAAVAVPHIILPVEVRPLSGSHIIPAVMLSLLALSS